MRTETRTCKYCGKEYSYKVSGDGCHDELNDDKYCPDCMKIMLDALKAANVVRHQYHTKYKLLSDEEIEDYSLNEKIIELDEEYSKYNGIGFMRCLPICDYKKLIGYVIQGFEFIKCIKDDDTFDWLALYQYDSATQEYLHIKKREGKSFNDNYRFNCSGQKTFKSEDVPVRSIDPPTANIFFMDPILGNPNKSINKPKQYIKIKK